MKKQLLLGLFSCFFITINGAFAQDNDGKAIEFLNTHLQVMFKILNAKPKTISSTCMDSLKKLHTFKEKIKNDTRLEETQKEVNLAILRDLYTNSIQFCQTDVQDICSHRVEPPIRQICNGLFSQN